MADMKHYAKRLAKVMPKLFQFYEGAEGLWFLDAIGALGFISYRVLSGGWSTSNQWGFWGPLADELKCEDVSRECEYDHDEGVQGVTCRFSTLLEAIAEAVCQEAERRTEKKQG